MNRLFIETPQFTKKLRQFLTDDEYKRIQQDLLRNPDCGDVMPDSGGLRKLRASQSERKKGKRGGARIIYLDVPEVEWILMVCLYDKSVMDDITVQDKKLFRQLAQEFKKWAKQAVNK